MSYRAPIKEIRFALEHMARLNELRQEGEAESLNPELLDAVFDAAARLAEDVLSPLQRVGDREGSRLENGVVVTPAGWREAYERYAGGGWNVAGPPETASSHAVRTP